MKKIPLKLVIFNNVEYNELGQMKKANQKIKEPENYKEFETALVGEKAQIVVLPVIHITRDNIDSLITFLVNSKPAFNT